MRRRIKVLSILGIIVSLLSARPCLADVGGGESQAMTAADEGSSFYTFLPLVHNDGTSMLQAVIPNDPLFTTQWALELIETPMAWTRSLGSGVLVAVLDTGVDFEHIDLAPKLRTDIDWDFVNDDDVAQDDHGHGTHVAGIAAAATNNSQGVVGIGWDAELLSLKVLSAGGSGAISSLISAIYYATDNGANVINMSLATDPSADLSCSRLPALVEALEYAYNHGVLTVVAAGNDNDDAAKVVPANCPYVLTVAATASDDERASFSNYGAVIDIAAPGKSIYSTIPGDLYGTKSGTSMATPFVSGLASLVWSRYAGYTPDDVANALLNNAIDLGDAGWDPEYGCGRINALEAVNRGASGDTPCRTDALIPPDDVSFLHHLAPSTVSPVPNDNIAEGNLIVRLNDHYQDTILSEYNIDTLRILADGTLLIRVPAGAEWETAQHLLNQGLIEYAQPDYQVFVQ